MRASLTLVALALGGASACVSTRLASEPAASPTMAALREGQRAMREGKSEVAIAAIRRSLAADPANREAMRTWVEAHFRAGRIDTLIAELEGTCAARPSDDVAHYELGLAYYAQSASAEAKAVMHLARAAELKPYVAEYPFRLGVVYLDAERFPEAAASLKKARDLDPTQARPHVPLAMALARTGDRKGAIEAIRAILSLSPERHDLEMARKVMARITDPFREFPKAIENDFQRGLDALEKTDAPQQALVTFEEILEKFPDLAVVHAALGLCYQRIDDSSRAMEEFRRAIELAPDDPRNHLYVADLYFAKERLDRAAEGYRAVLERDPLNDRAYERLGAVALRHGDSGEAAGWLKTLVILRPDDLDAHSSYGMALLGQDALDGATKEFEAVVAQDPKNTEALLRLSLIDVERSHREKEPAHAEAARARAVSRLEKVLDLQPQNSFAAKALEQLKPR